MKLDPAERERLEQLAVARGKSKGDVLREGLARLWRAFTAGGRQVAG